MHAGAQRAGRNLQSVLGSGKKGGVKNYDLRRAFIQKVPGEESLQEPIRGLHRAMDSTEQGTAASSGSDRAATGTEPRLAPSAPASAPSPIAGT